MNAGYLSVYWTLIEYEKIQNLTISKQCLNMHSINRQAVKIENKQKNHIELFLFHIMALATI